jgi:hypothetical protein
MIVALILLTARAELPIQQASSSGAPALQTETQSVKLSTGSHPPLEVKDRKASFGWPARSEQHSLTVSAQATPCFATASTGDAPH